MRTEDYDGKIYEEEMILEQAIQFGVNKQLLEDVSENEVYFGYKFDEVKKIASNIMGIRNDIESLIRNFEKGNFLEIHTKNNEKYIRYTAAGDGPYEGMCVDISDISYLNGIYTVTFTYTYLPSVPLEDQEIDYDNLEEAKVRFRYDETNSISKFKMIDYKLITNSDETSITPVDKETNSEELALRDISEMAIEFRNGENKGETNIVKNYKEFEYDLDGDGLDEIIRFEKNKEELAGVAYNLYLNGEEFDSVESSVCSIYVVDLNKNDSNKEVVIYDDGPSDDPHYNLYVMENRKMKLLHCFNAGFDEELKCDGNGNMVVGNRITDCIQPRIYDKVYSYENGNLSYSDTNIDLIKNDWYEVKREEDWGWVIFTEDLSNIDKFLDAYSQSTENDDYFEVMKKNGLYPNMSNIKFKILEFTENEEVKVQLEDGRIGYLFHHAGHLAG